MQASVKDSGVLKVDTAVADSYKVTKSQITFTRGTSGQAVDKDALYERITDAVDDGDYETVIAALMKDSEPKALDIDKVYKKVYTKAKDATLDPKNNYAIVASTTGISFDKKEAAAAIEGLEEGESKSISLKLTTADITTQNLTKNLFKDRLGTYSTNVAGTAARINNVRLASQHCNNTILLPGETFSYNGVVGQRTAAPWLPGGRRVPQRQDCPGAGRRHLPGVLHPVLRHRALQPGDRPPREPYVRVYLRPPGAGRHGFLGRAGLRVQEQHQVPHQGGGRLCQRRLHL